MGGFNYTYGICEFDITVSQYVTFLNTVDPSGRNTLQLYFDDMNLTVWPKVWVHRVFVERSYRSALFGGLSGVGGQAVQFRGPQPGGLLRRIR